MSQDMCPLRVIRHSSTRADTEESARATRQSKEIEMLPSNRNPKKVTFNIDQEEVERIMSNPASTAYPSPALETGTSMALSPVATAPQEKPARDVVATLTPCQKSMSFLVPGRPRTARRTSMPVPDPIDVTMEITTPSKPIHVPVAPIERPKDVVANQTESQRTMAFLIPGVSRPPPHPSKNTTRRVDVPSVVLSEKTRSYVETLRQKNAERTVMAPPPPFPSPPPPPSQQKPPKTTYASVAKRPVVAEKESKFPREFVDHYF